MSKYIEAYKLKAEIKWKIAEIEKEPAPADRETILLQMCKINAFREVLSVINRIETLQQEQPEMDLEKEIDNYLYPIQPWEVMEEPFTSLEKCARHFYELVLNARK